MSQAKIEIEIGAIRFSGEGEQEWLSEQLTSILESAESLLALTPAEPQASESVSASSNDSGSDSSTSTIANQSLATYLKDKNATSSQVDKFLAAAAWTAARTGMKNLKTSDVSAALSKASQGKINNPSDKLKQNVAKGYCEKVGSSEFFITQEGLDRLSR